MRIDAYLPSYSPDRGPRSGTAVTPYREAQREVEVQREQPAAPAPRLIVVTPFDKANSKAIEKAIR